MTTRKHGLRVGERVDVQGGPLPAGLPAGGYIVAPAEVFMDWLGRIWRVPIAKGTSKRWVTATRAGGPSPTFVLPIGEGEVGACGWGNYALTPNALLDHLIGAQMGIIDRADKEIVRLEALRGSEPL